MVSYREGTVSEEYADRARFTLIGPIGLIAAGGGATALAVSVDSVVTWVAAQPGANTPESGRARLGDADQARAQRLRELS